MPGSLAAPPRLGAALPAVARAALERRESRGAQFRDDYPQKDEALGQVNHILRKGDDGEMQLEAVPITELTPAMEQIIEDNK